MMSTRATSEGWQIEGDSAEAYERYLASAFSPWARQLTELADVRGGDRVLDVACGTGIVARHAADRAGEAGRVVGVDVNADMLRVARVVSAGVRPAIEWRRGDAAELPFPAAAFDVVVCEQAIQFFSDPVAALTEMRRVMAPGARAAVSVCRPIRYCPTYEALAGTLERHAGPEAGMMMRSPFSVWDTGQFRALFTHAGFPDVHVGIDVCCLRYPSCEEFVRREASSSPLAGPIGALDEATREALVRDLRTAIADYVDDDGVVCPLEVYVALARRGD
jgi:ubiquinone/menaquinone biosynthesis C-methylase UbiE